MLCWVLCAQVCASEGLDVVFANRSMFFKNCRGHILTVNIGGECHLANYIFTVLGLDVPCISSVE